MWQGKMGLDADFSRIPREMVPKKVYNHFKKLNTAPIIYDIRSVDNSTIEELIKKQKEMRLKNRGWAGTLS